MNAFAYCLITKRTVSLSVDAYNGIRECLLSQVSNKNCVICYENTATVLFRPCLHVSICKNCCDEYTSHYLNCPMCKTTIQNFEHIYVS